MILEAKSFCDKVGKQMPLKKLWGGRLNCWLSSPLWQQGSPRVSAPWDTKARWQDVRPARKHAGIFNRRLQGWQAGTAAGQMKDFGRPSYQTWFPLVKFRLDISIRPCSLCFWDTHTHTHTPAFLHNFAVSKETTRCSPQSPAPMAGWLHRVREPIKQRSQSGRAEPDSLPHPPILEDTWT